MPEALTYTSLVSDVENYAERHDEVFLAQIPRLIMMAENRIANEVRNLGFLRVVEFTINASNSVYSKPHRWRQTKSMFLTVDGEQRYLKERTTEYLQEYWPDGSSESQPLFYADYDYEHWLILPLADQDYSAKVSYYERPIPLDENNQTNWTTRHAPQLLLYATLLEAQPFLKTSERVPEFQQMYMMSAGAVKGGVQ